MLLARYIGKLWRKTGTYHGQVWTETRGGFVYAYQQTRWSLCFPVPRYLDWSKSYWTIDILVLEEILFLPVQFKWLKYDWSRPACMILHTCIWLNSLDIGVGAVSFETLIVQEIRLWSLITTYWAFMIVTVQYSNKTLVFDPFMVFYDDLKWLI